MTIGEAKKILKENRPNKPRKIEGKRFQAAIDMILDYQEGLEKKILRERIR
jgi:hypothetical protein